jgi:hypothetical protein
MAYATVFPSANTPIIDLTTGYPTNAGYFFFLALFNRTGGTNGNNINSFTFPSTNGTNGQVLTSQGTNTLIFTSLPAVPTELSSFQNNTGYITSASLNGLAPIANPNFTGSPQVPTAVAGANNGVIANTAFVQETVNNAVANIHIPGSTGSSYATASGTTQANAPELTVPRNIVNSAAFAGALVKVIGDNTVVVNGSGKIISVVPPVGGTISGVTGNLASGTARTFLTTDNLNFFAY